MDKYRQDTAYTDGKRAAMLMPLQCNRNDEIVDRICQFMDCIFASKTETKESITKIENDIWDSLRQGKEANHSDLMWKEKLYEKDMHYMLEERTPDNCLARKLDALETLSAIDNGTHMLLIKR